MLLLLVVTVFLTVTLIVFLIGQYLNREQALVIERLKQLEAFGLTKDKSALQPEEESWIEKSLVPLKRDLANWLNSMTPVGIQKEMQTKLGLAGNPFGWQVSDFLVLQALTAGLLPLLFTLVLIFLRVPVEKLFLWTIIMVILGLLGPRLWLTQTIKKRQKEILCALPDTLDLLTVSVEAGLGFDSALAKVVEKTKGPLAQEMGKVLQEIRMGKPRRDALKDLSMRTGVDDLRSFTAAIIQADQLGVSISNVLKIQSEQMRQRRRQRAEEAAMKAPVKMLFPLVFFIFPTIFIILLGPAVLQMIDTFSKMGN